MIADIWTVVEKFGPDPITLGALRLSSTAASNPQNQNQSNATDAAGASSAKSTALLATTAATGEAASSTPVAQQQNIINSVENNINNDVDRGFTLPATATCYLSIVHGPVSFTDGDAVAQFLFGINYTRHDRLSMVQFRHKTMHRSAFVAEFTTPAAAHRAMIASRKYGSRHRVVRFSNGFTDDTEMCTKGYAEFMGLQKKTKKAEAVKRPREEADNQKLVCVADVSTASGAKLAITADLDDQSQKNKKDVASVVVDGESTDHQNQQDDPDADGAHLENADDNKKADNSVDPNTTTKSPSSSSCCRRDADHADEGSMELMQSAQPWLLGALTTAQPQLLYMRAVNNQRSMRHVERSVEEVERWLSIPHNPFSYKF